MGPSKLYAVRIITFIAFFSGIDSADLRYYNNSINEYVVISLDNPETLLVQKGFSKNRTTVIHTFGFGGTPTDESATSVLRAYLDSGDVNTCLFNWEKEANNGVGPLLYAVAIERGEEVGEELGQALIKLKNKGLNLDLVHLIGHSLGAQVMGTAGKTVQKQGGIVKRITGLEIAGPLLTGNVTLNPSFKLDYSCATFVDAIITNPGKLGTSNPMATANIFPNCGSSIQPGCENATVSLNGTQIYSPDRCSHNRSYQYYAEAVRNRSAFVAISATNCTVWKSGGGSGNKIYLGEYTNTSSRGNYYLSTNNASLFGKGADGLQP